MLHDDEESYLRRVRRALRLLALPPEEIAALAPVPLQRTGTDDRLPQLEGVEAVRFLRTRTGRGIGEIQSALKTFGGDLERIVAHFDQLKIPAEKAYDRTEKMLRDAADSSKDQEPWELLVSLCDLRLGHPFPPFPLSDSLPEDDFRNLDHLLGSTHEKPVPW